MNPWILLLTGSSSSGKSSLARELINSLACPTVLVEADKCFPVVHAGPGEVPANPAIVAFHAGLAAWGDAGWNVIVDGSLPYGNDSLRRRCIESMPSERVHFLAVECSVRELRRREAVRPESREIGWAERQRVDVNDGIDAFMTVDTSERTAREWAALIRQRMSSLGLCVIHN